MDIHMALFQTRHAMSGPDVRSGQVRKQTGRRRRSPVSDLEYLAALRGQQAGASLQAGQALVPQPQRGVRRSLQSRHRSRHQSRRGARSRTTAGGHEREVQVVTAIPPEGPLELQVDGILPSQYVR
jgi:hypothetical protein